MRLLKFISISLVLFSIGSCDILVRNGCTDGSAENYDSKASRSDGSCIYRSSGVLYWDNGMNNYFNFNGITSVTIEFAGEVLVENADISQYDYLNNPSCNGTNWPAFDTYIYKDYSQLENVILYDQNDSLILSEIIYLGKGCNTYEIQF